MSRGRKLRLKKGIKIPNLCVINSRSPSSLNYTHTIDRKNLNKVFRSKKVIAKSPIPSMRNWTSYFSPKRRIEIKLQTKRVDSFGEARSPEIRINRKLVEKEEKKWTSIHCSMIFSMKQKVQEAKDSRLKGFLSPLRLMQKINDVRNNNIGSVRSLSMDRNQQVIDMDSSRYSKKDITPSALRLKFNAARWKNPSAFMGNIF